MSAFEAPKHKVDVAVTHGLEETFAKHKAPAEYIPHVTRVITDPTFDLTPLVESGDIAEGEKRLRATIAAVAHQLQWSLNAAPPGTSPYGEKVFAALKGLEGA
jgi:hypothetical protein